MHVNIENHFLLFRVPDLHIWCLPLLDAQALNNVCVVDACGRFLVLARQEHICRKHNPMFYNGIKTSLFALCHFFQRVKTFDLAFSGFRRAYDDCKVCFIHFIVFKTLSNFSRNIRRFSQYSGGFCGRITPKSLALFLS